MQKEYNVGDFNLNTGDKEVETVSRFILGEKNEAGDHLMCFCQENQLRITTIWFI